MRPAGAPSVAATLGPLARRDDREYQEYLREEQRSHNRGPQPGSRVGVEKGCSAGRMQSDFHHGLLALRR